MLTITIFTIIDNNVMPVTGSMWAMRFSGIWKPGAMWFPMEVHDPGDHVPPADEAGGIVTRTATHMRSPSANTGVATCSIKRQPFSVPPMRWHRSNPMPRRYRRRGVASYVHAARDRVDPAEVEQRLAERETAGSGGHANRSAAMAQ